MPPPQNKIHGILRGFTITYRAMDAAGSILKTNHTEASSRSLNITGLESYTDYQIQIAAKTVKGLGPWKRVSACKILYLWVIPTKLYIHTHTYIHIYIQLFAQILSPWYISVYQYIECIVGRVPLWNLLHAASLESNVDKLVISSIYWAGISFCGYMLMIFLCPN